MMACAQTGSGKTAAFLLPMIHKLLEESVDPHMGLPATPEVIVVSPTRELALQITKEAMKFAKGSKLGAYTVYGGTQVGYQRDRLREKNINIVVATPGRLLQFIRDDTISLRNLMFFVLDEADRMLDMGFQVKNFVQPFFCLYLGSFSLVSVTVRSAVIHLQPYLGLEIKTKNSIRLEALSSSF